MDKAFLKLQFTPDKRIYEVELLKPKQKGDCIYYDIPYALRNGEHPNRIIKLELDFN